ncbi:hypothetical protein Tco_1423983 [Tanacetum coccineum]
MMILGIIKRKSHGIGYGLTSAVVLSMCICRAVLELCYVKNSLMDWNMIISPMSRMYCGSSIGSVIRRVGFAACVYLIWQERNSEFSEM